MTFKTEQEAFWAGDFGTEYIQRNQGDALLASNLDFFAKALRQARGVQSCIEFGANIGMNLKALKLLHPGGFHLGNDATQRRWNTATGKARFIPSVLPEHLISAGVRKLKVKQIQGFIYAAAVGNALHQCHGLADRLLAACGMDPVTGAITPDSLFASELPCSVPPFSISPLFPARRAR